MTTYYLDIESDTQGRERPDPTKDTIVTIQFVPFYDDTGKKKEELTIMKSWEYSEEEILRDFLDYTGWTEDDPDPWRFVPAGYNIGYEFIILQTRARELLGIELDTAFLFQKLFYYDLWQVVLMANRGDNRGSSMENFTTKSFHTRPEILVANWDWDNLVRYIENEADAFLDLYRRAVTNVPTVIPRL